MIKAQIAGIALALKLLYPATATVTNLDYENDIVTCETSTGIEYTFEGTEDYEVDDVVALICYDINENGYVKDDEVVSARYGGYQIVDLDKLEIW